MAALQSLAAAADMVLRSGARDRPRPLVETDFRTLLALILSFGLCYGALMGTFSGVRGDHSLQILYSALKVPMLLLVTFGLSLPGFFVLNTLMGVRSDLVHALKALLAAQAGMTVILASFAPFMLLWYASNADYNQAILFNAALFAAATLASQRLLRRCYGPLLARDRRHRILLRVWLVTYGFVGIQMGWVLRPFIGAPWAATHFFREGAWTNAYEALFRLL